MLRKVARCILGIRNWVLTLLRRQRKNNIIRPAVGGWSFFTCVIAFDALSAIQLRLFWIQTVIAVLVRFTLPSIDGQRPAHIPIVSRPIDSLRHK